MKEALVFTRTKHRANRLAEYLVKKGVKAERIHGNRSQAQRTAALKGFKDGAYRVLVATDIAARGIDVEALGHVVNFDVPNVPDDYIHRVGRTARAELTGEAFTLVSPGEEEELRAIEKAISKRLPRVTVPDFDYNARIETRLEIPLAERIAVIRAKKADDRARAAAKKGGRPSAPTRSGTKPSSPRPAARRGDESPYAGSSERGGGGASGGGSRSGGGGAGGGSRRGGGRGRSGPSARG
jgi:ATP-dependent RNA helicase RhlE